MTQRRHVRARLLGMTLAIGILVACSGEAVEEVTPTPTETPTPELIPVAGEVHVTSTSTSTGSLLGLGGEPVPVDQAVLDAATTELVSWLDDHLDSLQRGTGGLLAGIADPALLDMDVSIATTDLASEDLPISEASYTLAAYHDGATEMISVTVDVLHTDDSEARASLVFVLREGTPTLVLIGDADEPEAGTA